MIQAATLAPEQGLHIQKNIDIQAPLKIVFEAVLEQLGPGFGTNHAPTAMKMKLEAWPGGRWFRDLGNNTGHLWGHVQVIKPPTLIEITGPLCMSSPSISHVQYRLTEQAGGTHLSFTHRAIGEIPQEHREGMPQGWARGLEQIRELAERRK
jgi:uncharacterized protein YndB with AHSA1/START domain